VKAKIRLKVLGMYDLILALSAIYIGVMMVSSNKGIFIEYPHEWFPKIPFESWFIPGIIAIVLFGLGNIIAAIFSFKKENSKSWLASAIIGGILFISIISQMIILGETYLATVELLILSIMQICICGYVFNGYRKQK